MLSLTNIVVVLFYFELAQIFYYQFKKARAYWLTSSKNSEPATAKNAAFHHTRTVAAIKNAVMQQNKMRELQSQVKRLTAQNVAYERWILDSLAQGQERINFETRVMRWAKHDESSEPGAEDGEKDTVDSTCGTE